MATGRNEGVQILEDFICDAAESDLLSPQPPTGRGANDGMQLVLEVSPKSGDSLTQERESELRALVPLRGAGKRTADPGPDLAGDVRGHQRLLFVPQIQKRT